MNWVRLAILVLDLAGDIVSWIEREKIKSEAERALIAEARNRIDARIKEAEAARARVRADLDANPGGLRDDDGFKRKPD